LHSASQWLDYLESLDSLFPLLDAASSERGHSPGAGREDAMSPVPQQRDEMLERIRSGLATAEARAQNLKQRSSQFILVNLICGALGTVVSGLAAAAGPVAGTGPHAWKLTCATVAVLTASSTFFSGLNQQLAIPDQLAKAMICVARLRALEMEITEMNRDLAEVTRQYEDVVASYQEFMF
jgi:hypothetical protein